MAREPWASCRRRAESSRVSARATASPAASRGETNATSSAPASTVPSTGGAVVTTGTPCATAFINDPRRADRPSRNGSAITSHATSHREMTSGRCSPVSTRRKPSKVLGGTGGSARRALVGGPAAPIRTRRVPGPASSGRRMACARISTPLLRCRKPKKPTMNALESRSKTARAARRSPPSAGGSMVGPAGIQWLFASPDPSAMARRRSTSST